MKFDITQFTLDTENFVNVSIPLTGELSKLINRKIFKPFIKSQKYQGWCLVYLISSHERHRKKVYVNPIPSKSVKYKEIEYYVYFPKISKRVVYPYNKRKFVKYFFEGLETILEKLGFRNSNLLKECLEFAISKIITNPRTDFREQVVYVPKTKL